jgi:glucose-1-phosphate cytidylyltransferase
MKVVLFCGGLGLRMREASERVPKPMVPVGERPILWHVMKYFAFHGHTDFILCLGYKAEVIKEYFLTYSEALSNDFVLSQGGRDVQLLSRDIDDWRITFVNTGLHATIGERLRAVQPHLEGEEVFLANYGDVLTNAPLPQMIENLKSCEKVASFLCVRPSYTVHVVSFGPEEVVRDVVDIGYSDVWVNGGYFVFRSEIFDYIHAGEDLVHEPFQRLIAAEQLIAYRYEGFWAPMDTLKDQQQLEGLMESGSAPWRVWDNGHDTGDPYAEGAV